LLSRAARRPVEQITDLLTPEATDVLLEHDWPGNVRELANVMEHAYIIAGGEKITPEHLPHHIHSHQAGPPTLTLTPGPVAAVAGARTLREIEMEHVMRVLAKHAGNKPAAAAELGISLKTLYNKLNQMQEERKTAG
jgi:DNA-binding NtrC family response regulator